MVRYVTGVLSLFVLVSCGGNGGGNSASACRENETFLEGEGCIDPTPDVFTFIDRAGAETVVFYESNEIRVQGLGLSVDLTVDGGTYSLNGGDFSSEPVSVSNGDTVVVRALSAVGQNQLVSVLLTIGDVSDSFDVTTLGGDPLPRGQQDWAMFGKDYAQSRHSLDTSIGRNNVDTLRVAHRVEGIGVSGTPAVVDGVMYYSDYDGWLHAVDAQTGDLHWQLRLQESTLTASVFVSGDTVYTGGDGSVMYAVERETGEVRWTTTIETTAFNRIWSSPVVVEDTLIIGSASFQGFVPSDQRGDVIFRGGIVGLDVETGEQKWRLSVCPEEVCGGGVSVWSSAAVDPELKMAYIGTGQAYYEPAGPYSDTLIAFNYETGERVWHYQFTENDVYNIDGGPLDHDIGATPNLFSVNVDGELRHLVGVGDKGGRYMAFDRFTGERVWHTTLGVGTPIGGVMGSAAYANGRIFVTTNTSVVGTSRFDPVPATGIAYALDASTGEPVWQVNLDAGAFGGTAVANGLMYFVTWNGVLRVLDSDTGDVLHTVPVGEGVGFYDTSVNGFPNGSTSGPVVANGRVYVGYGWTWLASVSGGVSVLQSNAQPAPLKWAPNCPEGFVPESGLNTGFMSDGFARSFSVLPAESGVGERPVFVSLTGTAQLENDFMRNAYIDQLPAEGITVISPIRICSAGGSNASCNTGRVVTEDGRTWEPWFDGVASSNTEQYLDEGTDVRFIERMVQCVATRFNVDQSKIFIGGISAGGTLTNRALTFRSDFYAGGIPASGEWLRTDGVSIEDEDVGDLVVEGRAGPRPLNLSSDALDYSINLVLWGGPTDRWYSNGFTGDLIANYAPSTKLASNYYATQDKVVTVSCTHDLDYNFQAAGHKWPSDPDMTRWMLETLIRHPKGTDKNSFHLTEPPNGLTCVLGSFEDH